MEQSRKKLGLGTAQFGMDYGVSNARGRVPPAEVSAILDCASANGFDFLDTAAAYGVSETVLGTALGPQHRFRIVTKTPRCDDLPDPEEKASRIVDTFYRSLERLRRDRVYGLLVHSAQDLKSHGAEVLVAALRKLQSQGLVEKIGVSVYTGRDIDSIIRLFTPDLVQLPLNLFDQRLVCSGHLRRLRQAGVEVHVRSVFLQGLLVSDVAETVGYFDAIKDHVRAWHRYLDKRGISRLSGALGFVMQCEHVDAVVVGVAALKELREICRALEQLPDERLDYARWAIDDQRFVDPSQWRFSGALSGREVQQNGTRHPASAIVINPAAGQGASASGGQAHAVAATGESDASPHH